jgi:hypothetical protein
MIFVSFFCSAACADGSYSATCGCWLTILKVKLSRPQSHRGNCGVGALSVHVALEVLVTLT